MRTVTACLLALALGVSTAMTGVATAQAVPAAAEAPAAKVARTRQIITQLKLYDLLMFGARKGLLSRPEFAEKPKSDHDRLVALLTEEMEARRAVAIDAMAAANADRFSVEQLDQLVQVSKIKYLQDMVLAGGDPSLATPNEAGMTEAERALFYEVMSQPWVGDFFTTFNYNAASPFITSAGEAAMARYYAN